MKEVGVPTWTQGRERNKNRRGEVMPLPYTREHIVQANNVNLIDYAAMNGYMLENSDSKSLHVKRSTGLYLSKDSNRFYLSLNQLLKIMQITQETDRWVVAFRYQKSTWRKLSNVEALSKIQYFPFLNKLQLMEKCLTNVCYTPDFVVYLRWFSWNIWYNA